VVVQCSGELAITDAGFDGDGVGPELNDAVEVLGRKQRVGRIGDQAERVARTKWPERLGARDQLQRLFHRARAQDALRRVGDVPGPIGHGALHSAHAARNGRPGAFLANSSVI